MDSTEAVRRASQIAMMANNTEEARHFVAAAEHFLISVSSKDIYTQMKALSLALRDIRTLKTITTGYTVVADVLIALVDERIKFWTWIES